MPSAENRVLPKPLQGQEKRFQARRWKEKFGRCSRHVSIRRSRSTSSGGARVDVKMTLTAQGCGMGTSIAADARNKILDLPGVLEADVLVVWDPPWTPEKISPEGRALLGIH